MTRPPQRAMSLIDADDLAGEAGALLASGFRLAALAAHDDGSALRVVYLFVAGPPDRRVELWLSVDPARPTVPSLGGLSFAASRFEREMHDLFGIVPDGHPFLRPLVLHQHWPVAWHPMLRDAAACPPMRTDAGPFPFVAVEGPGVYEIPVGPVHAGLIEPGHFRFSVLGETILKMKARLWFTHRGIEKLFEGRDIVGGAALAERISGDSAIGHNLAYCLAVEEASDIDIPDEAAHLRALLLEMERVYNHVADIGALCNDVGFGRAQASALTLREQLLRLNAEVSGHRLLRGAILPGGVALRRLPTSPELTVIAERFDELVELASSNTVVIDRFHGTAVLSRDDAIGIGTVGVVARASGVPMDARIAHTAIDFGEQFHLASETAGDVHARFLVRVHEVRTSLALIDRFAKQASALKIAVPRVANRAGSGVGIVEGWRGSTVHRVEVDRSGVITRLKVVDPSFLNWPALSVALADTIVPDFPLANKSFNLSYAGNDL